MKTNIKEFGKFLVMVLVPLLGTFVALVVLSFLIGFGEYKMTTTGNMLWGLFYVPHLVGIVWFIWSQYKQQKGA